MGYEIKYHCFVSYTRRHEGSEILKQRVIDPFIRRLREARLSVMEAPLFYDYLSLEEIPRDSHRLRVDLQRGLDSSVCMLSFLSPNYLESPWCRWEVETMKEVGETRGPTPAIVSVVLEDFINDPTFGSGLREIDIADDDQRLGRSIADVAQRVVRQVKTLTVQLANSNAPVWPGESLLWWPKKSVEFPPPGPAPT